MAQGGTTRITTCRAHSENRRVVEAPIDQLLFPFKEILSLIAAEEGVDVMTHGLYLQPCAGRLNEGLIDDGEVQFRHPRLFLLSLICFRLDMHLTESHMTLVKLK